MSEYIDREAFLESQRHLYCGNCARRKNGKGKFVYEIGDAPCRACDIGDVLDAVADIPAADVRPVVTGRWIDHQIGRWVCAKCSECETVHDVRSNFCPNCGADMRWEN